MCVAFCPVADRDAADFEIAALVADIRFSFSVDVEVEFTVFPVSDADELVPLVVEQGGAAQGALVVSVPSLMEKEKVLFISMRIYEPLSPSMFSRFWSAFSAFIHRAMVKGLSESPASSG